MYNLPFPFLLHLVPNDAWRQTTSNIGMGRPCRAMRQARCFGIFYWMSYCLDVVTSPEGDRREGKRKIGEWNKTKMVWKKSFLAEICSEIQIPTKIKKLILGQCVAGLCYERKSIFYLTTSMLTTTVIFHCHFTVIFSQ